jgi:flavin reductase (DIM6/NTAB) family NADH-FMN oxidoreductase RutF
MFFEPAKKDHGLPFDPFKAIVAPRPIGWISSLDAQGRANLAPYSFFNALSVFPHIVGFASDGVKDSLRNIEATKEFVCSFVSFELADAMNVTSKPVAHGVSEFELAGLASAPSNLVKPPRVAAAPAALECKYLRTIPMEGLDGKASYFLVLGEVVGVYLDEAYIRDGKLDTAAMQALARGGYHDYSVYDATSHRTLTRPE